MPVMSDIQKVLVIGSGPIIIGQAAEFDYAGTQACKSLREEGIRVVLVNSNPATIMTDADIADVVYVEPLTVQNLANIIQQERPDGLLPTLGGQTGLNLAVELAEQNILEKYQVKLLGMSLDTIKRAEDRELFRATMLSIDQPVPESTIVSTIDEGVAFGQKIGYPIIIRPAYTLGGTGGGIATNEAELQQILHRGLKMSMIGQVLLERSVAGWKEVEYEVMRDGSDNCIIVCSMENVDPVGVHTGDSIVVAPNQTLTQRQEQMLRNAAFKIMGTLGVEGGCNIQFALEPTGLNYYVIEVNPRVSRSSALASKATGYPIAKVAAKIAIGLTLNEIGTTDEPQLDYTVVKVPRWPFDKFGSGDRQLGTQMKATGEVMAIDHTFEGALMKSLRSLEIGVDSLQLKGTHSWSEMELETKLSQPDDERIFALAEALRRQWTIQEIYQLTKIDVYFLNKIKNIILIEEELRAAGTGPSPKLLLRAKEMGFTDSCIGRLIGLTELEVRALRKQFHIFPHYQEVKTYGSPSAAPYYYSSYLGQSMGFVNNRPKVLVLGSGPIRIGQGIEFDYCSVHSVWGLQQLNYEAIIINNNPETVSTDFDTADKLYFEPLTLEDVVNVVEREQPIGVIVQFGGQTAINLANDLDALGIEILGTPVSGIDGAEDRQKFEQLLRRLAVPQTEGKTATTVQQAVDIALQLGYPVLVRPSYVLGGRAMEIVYNQGELEKYMQTAVQLSPKHPVLVDKYVRGTEVEVDAIADGDNVYIPGIIEHVERAGVHSGDSIGVYPPQSLSPEQTEQIVDYTVRMAKGLGICGLINIQYVVGPGGVYVLEVNPRASRTVPVLSKVTGVPMVQVATKAMMGHSLTQQGYGGILGPAPSFVAVKAPVFSFEKLGLVETSLGPEMKSTGEVMGIDQTFGYAFYKAIVGTGMQVMQQGCVLFSVADRDKLEALSLARQFVALGFRLMGTPHTAEAFQAINLPVEILQQPLQAVRSGQIQLVINTPTRGKIPTRQGFKLRRTAAEYKVPCLTSLDTAKVLALAIKSINQGNAPQPQSLFRDSGNNLTQPLSS